MKRSFIYLFILMLLCTAGTAFAQGEIYGTVSDKSGVFPGVTVKVTQGGILKGGTMTDDDGKFSVKPLPAGSYDVEFRAQSYSTKLITSVVVSSGGERKVDVTLVEDAQNLGVIDVVVFRKPVIDIVKTVDAQTLERQPGTDLNNIVSLTANTYQQRSGGAVSIGGDRSNGTVYIVDGQYITGGATNPPQGTVEQLQVFTSGIPANLGDATGGVVSITTKGVTSELKGNIRGQQSFDGYNQSLLSANFTGPLVFAKRKDVKTPILGFLAGMEYQYNGDASPTFYKNPVLKEDVLKRLQDNPLTLVNSANGSQMVAASNFVGKDDFNYQKQQLNNSSTALRFNGKLDYAVNSNINITAGGSYTYNDDQNYNRSQSYFAPEAIPTTTSGVGRGYLRFKQSFNDVNPDTTKGRKVPVISNAYYTLQLDYQFTHANRENPNFKHNLFDYGYVGKFTQNRVPAYQFAEDSISGRKAVILQSLDVLNGITFQASDKNPILANYTRNVYENQGKLTNGGTLQSLDDIQRYQGLMNGDFPRYTLQTQNALINNIGSSQVGYSYSTSSQVGLHADAAFDFTPGKKKSAGDDGEGPIKHAIQFGLYYEQRSSSNYNAFINNGTGGTGTSSLWNRMISLTNSHIGAFDRENPIYMHNGVAYTKAQVDAGNFFLPTDTIIYNRKDNGTQSVFDANLRAKLGYGAFDYIDIHSIDPSKLSLDMFSADELLNQNQSFISYSGYDYTGKKSSGPVNFNDFFTAKDSKGNLTRPIAAFTPNYIAGYIMDAFRYKNLNFNLGVRIERYDNNTKVLKDPYSLYELNKKGTVDGARNLINGGQHPANIGDDYAVYVNNNASATPNIIGYRNGDKWYNANGTEIPDPTVLKELNDGTDPKPYLTEDGKIEITKANFDPNRSFTDYVPKVTASPRFNFSFPFNEDKAFFFAHYDILVQRPKEGNYATPLDYLYLEQNNNTIIDNSNLKPQKTFDYELGYQQTIGKKSGFGISAFYRERKDMIQVRPYLYAYPKTYYTYGNRDFSTTKGFTFTYEFKKAQNDKNPIEMSLAYTLQFADGTGSNSASSNGGQGNQVSGSGLLQNFISSGLPNLRYVAPLTYDSRHVINLNFNYKYENGEGPTIKGKHFLQNFNANMIMRARSGEPYTTYQNVVGNAIQGGLNGTRLNWHFGIDLRLDKSFAIGAKKAVEAVGDVQARPARAARSHITAFIYFQNLFNIKDVLGVYPYTSRPDDDGYIASTNGQQFFTTSSAPQTLQDLYSLYVNNPGYYNSPRRANVGFTFNF